MKTFVALVALIALTQPVIAANKTSMQDPVVWGVFAHNSGCVIFKEGRKTSGMFWGVAVTMKWVGKLTVVETQDYNINPQEYLETQENMNDLMRLAQKDHVKFVKIPEKYSPAQLDKAREFCKEDLQ
jgi:hypothetical protein